MCYIVVTGAEADAPDSREYRLKRDKGDLTSHDANINYAAKILNHSQLPSTPGRGKVARQARRVIERKEWLQSHRNIKFEFGYDW